MLRIAKGIVKCRIPILILSVLLLIPSCFGFLSTRINYDIFSYLPGDIETMQGQDILLDEVFVAHPRDFFDDHRKSQVTEVRVFLCSSRGEPQGPF